MKERVTHREREGRALGVLERFYYVFFFFFNIVLTRTIVGAPKASVLYVYIDVYRLDNSIICKLNYSYQTKFTDISNSNSLQCEPLNHKCNIPLKIRSSTFDD